AGVASRPGRPLPMLARSSAAPPEPSHLAWVWEFRHDGAPAQIRDVLAAHDLGIVLKTHDGTDWMSEFDPGPDAIDGPGRVAELARFFEQAGIPFHAWTVLEGDDPVREAELAAQVLDAGARSVFLDLEAHAGFWRGSSEAALRFGEELRRRRPDAWLPVSVDARPWEIARVPLAEFATFADEVAPQAYWGAFDSRDNLAGYREWGEEPAGGRVTPAFVLEAAARALAPFGLPVHPIGDGTVQDQGEWTDFVDRSLRAHAESVSVWRFGVTPDSVWRLLAANPPRPASYLVQPGDTLSELAETWHTDTTAIASANEITNPNLLYVGQRLRVPRSGAAIVSAPTTPSAPAAPMPGSPAPATPPPASYLVRPGDTLWALARERGTTVEAIARANGIADASHIWVGQLLRIP
ncbi:MAG: LysM peptidoglycan-binding domain-containing protein, partial [Chloroflexi bacterium]|nr:LysM peptidoglycan-binding domain-containing protein [Chloroflexota bacterium]